VRLIRYRFQTFVFDARNRELSGPQGSVVLPLQESLVLEALLRESGEVVSKRTISQALWPDQYGDFDRAINNIVSKLRRSLGPNRGDGNLGGQCILTIPKAGYRMQCSVSVEAPAPPAHPSLAPAAFIEPAEIGDALSDTMAAELPVPQQGASLPPASIAASLPAAPASKARRSRLLLHRWVFWSAACLIPLAAFGFRLASHRTPPSQQPIVLGIIPLEVTGDDAAVGETLRGELADSIAEIPNVQVRAAHSLSLEMGRSGQSLQRAAETLSLDLILLGSLSLDKDRYQLDLELVRGSDSAHLHSFHFAGPRSGLPGAPAAVESALYEQLARNHGRAENSPQLAQGSTQNVEAYNLAFQAAHLLDERSKPSLDQAISLYRRALQLDSHFARAWSGLAEAYLVTADFGAGAGVQQNLVKTRDAANQAIQLNPDDARAHSVLGLLLLQHDWNLPEAERELRAAIRLNPGLAANHMRLAVLFADRKDFQGAEAETALAHQLDPLWPIVYGTSLYVHIMGRKYPEAIQDGQSLVATRPSWGRAHQQLGWAYWYGGKHPEAIREWRQAAVLDKDSSRFKLEDNGLKLIAEEGVRAYAHAKIAALGPHGADGDFVPSEWYAFAGDRAETLAALKSMVNDRDPESLKIPINPAYDFLRNDPNYMALKNQIDLEPRK